MQESFMRFSDAPSLVKSARRAPYLTREREAELVDLGYRLGSEAAKSELVLSHMRMSVALASRFRNYGLPLGDLIQEGNIGLLEAARRFDPSHGTRFYTYASLWMRAAIQNYVLNNWSLVKIGTSATQKSLFFNLRKVRARIESRGSAPRIEVDAEIARKFGVTVTQVEFAEARLGADHSLNAPVSDEDDGIEFIDRLADGGLRPDEAIEQQSDADDRRATVQRGMAALDDREKLIVSCRWLCEHEDAATLADLSRRLGVSRERVRQIEERALAKMREALAPTPGKKSRRGRRSGPRLRKIQDPANDLTCVPESVEG